MLRALSLAVLTVAILPSFPAQASDETVIAQQQQQSQPPQTQKRGCERTQQGVS